MARKRIPSFTEQLQAAIRTSGLTQYRISVEAGVPRETISRFLMGKVGMSLPTVDAIVKVLRLRLVVEDEESEHK